MRRRLVLLVAVATLALAAPGTVQPAAGFHQDACAGFGFANLSPKLGYMALGEPFTSSSFVVNIVFGTCASGFSFSAFGTVQGWCESTTGWGVTNTGHEFTITGSALSWVLAGEATGTMKLYAERIALPCEPEIGDSYRATTDVVLVEHPL
jgi:hypothetical protein